MDDDEIDEVRSRIRARIRASNEAQDMRGSSSNEIAFAARESLQSRLQALSGTPGGRLSIPLSYAAPRPMMRASAMPNRGDTLELPSDILTSDVTVSAPREVQRSMERSMERSLERGMEALGGARSTTDESTIRDVSTGTTASEAITATATATASSGRDMALRSKLAGDAAAQLALGGARSADPGGTHTYDSAYGDALIHWMRAVHRLGKLGDASEDGGRNALHAIAQASELMSLQDINQGLRPLVLDRVNVRDAFRMIVRTFHEMPDATRRDTRTHLTSLEIVGAAWPCIRDSSILAASTVASTVASAVASTVTSTVASAVASTVTSTVASADALSTATKILIASLIEMVAVPQLAGPCFEGRRNRVAQALSLALDEILAAAPRSAPEVSADSLRTTTS